MKKLPKMKYTDSITRQTQVRFGGYNHTKHAKDGDIYDMKNITAEHYPLITPREKRDICTTTYSGTLKSIGTSDKFYCIGDKTFYYDGTLVEMIGTVKQVADTGNYLFLLPEEQFKKSNCYIKNTGKMMGTGHYASVSQEVNYFSNGTVVRYYIALENTKIITRMPFIYYFYEGSAVPIFFAIKLKDGRILRTIRTMTDRRAQVSDGWQTNLYEASFAEDESWGCSNEEIEIIYATTSVPFLNYVCGTDNRIWGCDDKNIYCSAFGKPMEWFYYEASSSGNVADNSWSIEPFDGGGDFTGCTVYRGTPIFFKENMVYEIYGDNPSNFRLQTYKVPGVAKGSHKSLQVIKDVLYYLSPEGVMRYSGGIVDNLSTQFNQQLEEGVGGNDGLRYYLSAKADGVYKLFVYDLERRIWTVEDSTQVLDFALYNRRLYMLNGSHQLMCINPGTHSSPISKTGDEAVPEAVIEFADCYMDTVDKKAISKIFARFSVEDGGAFEILIRYDSGGEWKSVKKITASSQKTYTLPIIPKRCDHFKIKIIGKRFVLHALSYEYYNGSTL